MMKRALTGALMALALGQPLWAAQGEVIQLSPHMGEMMVTMSAGSEAVDDRLRFEPYQMLDDLFARSDYVLLMRHGPTDWSKLDVENVAPTDCANQRIMSPQGEERMRDLGTLMAANGLVPGEIVVSQWCRNQQTIENIQAGMDRVEPGLSETIETVTNPDLNLLLSLQGAPDVVGLRELVSSWTGEGAEGPLLLISHFTNIEELTNFQVFEGEMLMIDPKRNNRVLGYLRLSSAEPDIGHFNFD